MVHSLAIEKGWHDDRDIMDPHHLASMLALIHTEVSEATECVRNGEVDLFVGVTGKPTGMPSELADIIIRVLDMSGALGIDMGELIEQKHAYNQTRPHRHGNKRL